MSCVDSESAGVTFGFMNINSLRSHISVLREFLSHRPGLLALGVAETWLGAGVPNDMVSIEGFNIIRNDRNVHGGGVALYVRNDLKVTVLAQSNTTSPGKPGVPEFIFCKLQQGSSEPMLVSVIYRPPKIGFKEGSSLVDDLSSLCLDYRTKIVMGDLNANLLSDSDDSKFVIKLFDELSMQLIRHGPTHITTNSQTWIDTIFVDRDTEIMGSNTVEPTWPSKHRYLDVTLKHELPQTQQKCDFYYRDYRSIDDRRLWSMLRACEWDTFEKTDDKDITDVDKALEQLCKNLGNCIEELAPLKRVKSSKNKEPWSDAELRNLYRKRDALYRRYARTDDLTYYEEYTRLRDLAIIKSEEARSEFLKDKIGKALQSKNIWKELRGLGLLPKQKTELNGFSPDELNTHFARVSVSSSVDNNLTETVLQEASVDGFSFRPVGWADVVLAIRHFTSQAVGEDGIPQCVVVRALPVICPFLIDLYNSSLTKGIFPSLWKKSNIIPLKKCSAPSDCSDFRPISILCFLSKVLEKLAHEQLSEYLTKFKILDPLQTGFRAHNSTQTALLKLTDDIRLGMDRKLITFLVQFDFSKAFDTVSPALLLRKLSMIGLSKGALCWVWSYLADRKQSVVSRTQGRSSYLDTDLGVPQGSVLGPLLFCIYINDIGSCLVDARVRHLLYADDLQIYVQVASGEASVARDLLEQAAVAVSEWAEGAGLRLNTAKTKAAIFGTRKFTDDVLASGLSGLRMADGTLIPFSETVQSLGVVLDTRLSWKPHITSLSRKFNKVLYSLRSFRQYTTESLRRQLVMALLFPLLDYCSVVLIDASLEQQVRLQVMQNACTRYVVGLRQSDNITPHRVKQGWQRISTRRDYSTALTMYKVSRLREPSYLHKFFHPIESVRPVRGETKELIPTRTYTTFGRNSFQVRGADLWNSIPSNIRNLPSLSRFKTAIRSHLQALD